MLFFIIVFSVFFYRYFFLAVREMRDHDARLDTSCLEFRKNLLHLQKEVSDLKSTIDELENKDNKKKRKLRRK